MHWRGLTELSHRDYTPLALVSEDPAAIHVRADGPYGNAKALLAHIRANPGQLKASGVGRGGIWHLSTVGWLTTAGLKSEAMQWVASAGPAPALQDLAIDGVDVVVCSIPEVRATPDAKTTRSLTVMARQRHPRYPEVPTLQEATGLRYAVSAWRGVAGPKGLPREMASKLANALKKAWDSKEFKDSMRRRGFRPVWSSATEFAAFMASEDKRLGATVQAAGLAKA
jgi:tripartite-type tricarboxylate transporter receptor subunit TctC